MLRRAVVLALAMLFTPVCDAAFAQKNPSSRSVCLNQSRSYSFDQVRLACEALIASSGDVGTVYGARISLGIALGEQGDFSRSAEEFTEAIRLLPNETAGYTNRGIALRNLGNYEAAIADYDEALRINPRNARALNNRCWARAVTARDLESALQDCNASLLIESDPNTNGTRCLVHLHLQNFQAAFDDCDLAYRAAPEARSLYGRGLAQRGLGLDGADDDMGAAVALDSGVASEYASFGIRME